MSFITSLGDWLRKITRSFTSASISGHDITLTRHNGDTVVLTTTDTDVNVTTTRITELPLERTSYYITVSTTLSTKTEGLSKIGPSASLTTLEGTTTVEGMIQLGLGNNIPKGTNGNRTGRIALFTDTGNYHYIIPHSGDTEPLQTIYTPKASGTLVCHKTDTAVGSVTKPVYVTENGVVTACTYELNKSVPADAVFTDTVYSAMYFSQTSGSYIAPYSGVYRVTLKGGGGGGGGRVASTYATGGGGGEGGTLIFYVTLTQGQSYAYTIGAGGAGGSNDASASSGANGGSTLFGNDHRISGGYGGYSDSNSNGGGRGGYTMNVPSGVTAYMIPGQSGQSGCRGAGAWCKARAMGGGCSTSSSTGTPYYGAGGSSAGGRAGNTYDALSGADGYILIEYAG